MTHTTTAQHAAPTSVTLDLEGRVQIPPGAAISAALLRIALGLLYLWAFVEQAFGISYSNSNGATPPSYGWHFAVDTSKGWISSGFSHSVTAGFVGSTHGPLAFIPQHLPTGLDDFGWMFAIGGLGLALTFGFCMRIAGWGGFALNILIWFCSFPPSGNPVIDGTHTVYALLLLVLMFLHAGNKWGVGRWWEQHTPSLVH
jgi:thiosulfate dehydrogenase [quinone] large subunit